MKSVHHLQFALSAVKSCFSRFSNTLWGLPGFAPGFLGRTMERRPISVFMYRCGAVTVFPASQIYCHAAVSVHAIVAVVDIPDSLLDIVFLIISH